MNPREVSANGVRFALLEAGSGPLALCLHGFPDSAHTFRHLLPKLAGAGWHAVAPFTRGYAPTAIPDDGRYDVGALADDANAIHEALGGDERAVLIGHDWGAETAYIASARAPERWRRVVTIAIPPAVLDDRLLADPEQIERFAYIDDLRSPGAHAMVAAEDMAYVDRLWRAWSPGYDATDDLRRAKACLRDPANLTAAIAYYRADAPEPVVGPQPTLYLHGETDGCIAERLVVDAAEHLAPGSRMEVVDAAGHFLHLERPTAVDDRIVEWVSA